MPSDSQSKRQSLPSFLPIAFVVLAAVLLWWFAQRPPTLTVADTEVHLAPLADSRVLRTRESVVVGNGPRSYVLARPAELEPGVSYPLLVAFHGYRGEVKAWLHESAAFDALVAEKKFIIAYPEAPISWDATTRGRDLPFFDALVLALEQKFPVDPARVHVLGHSNGAAFASFLLYARPAVIAAGAAYSGIATPALPLAARKAPLLLIWGERDEFSPAASDRDIPAIAEWRRAGFQVETWFLPNCGHGWGAPANHVEERILDFFFQHPMDKPGQPAR